MKKLLAFILSLILSVCAMSTFTACGEESIIVYTNAFFAPFEYYSGSSIVGVDVDIMNKVGQRLGKKVEFKNVEFATIIDAVAAGKVCDAGAAGITVTTARAQKVDFSTKYYKSVQYVIYDKTDSSISLSKNSADEDCIFWADLAGKRIGVQTDTTGDIYVDIEINGDGPDYAGELNGSNASQKRFDNVEVAANDIGLGIDVVVIDKLPAQFICSKNSKYACVPLYYDAETATEEEYAICVPKGSTELLNAINAVLAELLVVENGETGIEKLVKQHMGLN